MTAKKIDGLALAASLLAITRDDVAAFIATQGRAPGLAVILVGEDAASTVYVRNKLKQTGDAGIRSYEHRLPPDTSQQGLLALISDLNLDGNVDGILVQLPLPAQIDASKVLIAIAPEKDVDGFHPMNVGMLATGKPALVPCTPLGCVLLAKSVLGNLTGLEVVVVGRSNIVGKPLAQLLGLENATVTIAHSGTQDIGSVCRRADLLFVAVGHAELVRGEWIKPGAVVIDVGINRVARATDSNSEGPQTRLVGDVAFEEAMKVAWAVTPVPGGVGPMTIACLLQNTMRAARLRAGIDTITL
jgi:methylenetetrahydrofolate dehydrogenase (NADP+)/methenyltetrahydrofolate cyclohydrolase